MLWTLFSKLGFLSIGCPGWFWGPWGGSLGIELGLFIIVCGLDSFLRPGLPSFGLEEIFEHRVVMAYGGFWASLGCTGTCQLKHCKNSNSGMDESCKWLCASPGTHPATFHVFWWNCFYLGAQSLSSPWGVEQVSHHKITSLGVLVWVQDNSYIS